ncbi:hypothetical protein CDD83_3484 [Cordyceps sp. RAO-2017]|nr:hypothetical protein CDD83_3484 [Cordyceps sp. RAO-2017]
MASTTACPAADRGPYSSAAEDWPQAGGPPSSGPSIGQPPQARPTDGVDRLAAWPMRAGPRCSTAFPPFPTPAEPVNRGEAGITTSIVMAPPSLPHQLTHSPSLTLSLSLSLSLSFSRGFRANGWLHGTDMAPPNLARKPPVLCLAFCSPVGRAANREARHGEAQPLHRYPRARQRD